MTTKAIQTDLVLLPKKLFPNPSKPPVAPVAKPSGTPFGLYKLFRDRWSSGRSHFSAGHCNGTWRNSKADRRPLVCDRRGAGRPFAFSMPSIGLRWRSTGATGSLTDRATSFRARITGSSVYHPQTHSPHGRRCKIAQTPRLLTIGSFYVLEGQSGYTCTCRSKFEENKRADERTRTADLLQLRVCLHTF